MGRRVRGSGYVSDKPRADGLYVGQIDLGWVGGTRKRKTVYGHSRPEVERKMKAERTKIEAGGLGEREITVEAWLLWWLENIAAPSVKPHTLSTYRTYVHEYLVPILGKKRLDRLTPAHVLEMHRAITGQTHRRTGKPLSSTTALHAHRVLSTALTEAMRHGRVIRNAASLVDAPRRAPHQPEALTFDQAKAVLELAEERMKSRWLAGMMLGARQGELLGLRWPFVDLETGMVDIAWKLERIPYKHGCEKAGKPTCERKADRCPLRTLAVSPSYEYQVLDGNLCLSRPKTTGSQRLVTLPDPLLYALILRREQYEAEREHYAVDHDLVWARWSDDPKHLGERGRPIDGRADWQAWKDLLAAAKIPHMRLHAGRNTAATMLLETGSDARIVSEILGHSSVAMSRAYQQVRPTLQREALARVAERLGLMSGA